MRAIFSLFLTATCLLAAEVPRVDKVEPPNWWIAHSHNPVRLLIRGEHLHGAQLEVPAGFSVANLRVADSGGYLFADLTIPASARPGEAPLRLSTPGGSAAVPFPLLKPLSSKRRFQGMTPDDVIYLLMPDRFANGDAANDDPAVSRGMLDRQRPRHYHGGDFQGVINHLPYLKDLGVTALWLTPWYDNVNHLNQLEKYTTGNQRSPQGRPSTDYHGYGAVDFYGVEEHFGDLARLRALADRTHAAGLKFVQDQVANHTGPYHPWATNPPTPTWFNGTVAQHLDNSWQIWTIAATNPPADKLQSTLEGWFINILPDLNQNDPETATYLIQNSLWWVGMTGADVVRQDTLPYVPRAYWARWTAALKRQYPRLTILGELWDGNPQLVAFFQGGRKQFDGVDSGVETLFDFPMHYAIRDAFAKGASMARLADTLAADTNYVNSRVLVTFLGLHDTSRFLSEPGATLDGLKLAFTYLLTARGTPLLYYGDEIAMRGGGDPDNRRDFPGGWPEDSHNAFKPSGRTDEEQVTHEHVKKLLTLRRTLAPLRQGKQEFLSIDAETCAFTRTTDGASVLVAINKGSQPRELQVPLSGPAWSKTTSVKDRLGDLGRIKISSGSLTLRLPPRTAAILAP